MDTDHSIFKFRAGGVVAMYMKVGRGEISPSSSFTGCKDAASLTGYGSEGVRAIGLRYLQYSVELQGVDRWLSDTEKLKLES